MLPLLFTGDIIEYRKTSLSKVSINDIVLTYKRGVFMTHRVIYKTNRYVITRGDNNRKADEKIFAHNIMGKVSRFKRKGTWHTIEEQYIAQSLYYLKEVQRISRHLHTQNIPHVFIKGVMTSLKHYGKLPQRIYADCDLLIHREDFLKVRSIFQKEGYVFIENQQSLVLRSKDAIPKFEGDFYKKVDMTPVYFDVHLEPVFLMTKVSGMDLLYKDSLRKELGTHLIRNKDWIHFEKGEKYPICSITDQILYLALHFFHHNNTDITRLYFIHELVRINRKKIKWDELINTVKRFSLEAYIYPAFLLMGRYFRTPLPRSIWKRLTIQSYKKKVIEFSIRNSDIFSEDTRLRAGVLRFTLIFLLSPEPIWKKILLFIHPDTITTALWVFIKKLSTFISFKKKREYGGV